MCAWWEWSVYLTCGQCTLYMYNLLHVHVFKWEMRRKKERSKQGQTNKQGKATQHTHMYMNIIFSFLAIAEDVPTLLYMYCTSFICRCCIWYPEWPVFLDNWRGTKSTLSLSHYWSGLLPPAESSGHACVPGCWLGGKKTVLGTRWQQCKLILYMNMYRLYPR